MAVNPGLNKGITRPMGENTADNPFLSDNVVANRDGSLLERSEYGFDDNLALARCVEKTDGAVLTGADPIFTITGGPVMAQFFGIVTTLIVGASDAKLTITTVTPAGTSDMSAGAVTIDDDAAGTSYQHINTTAVLTPVTAGFVMTGNAFATEDVSFLCPIGTVNFHCTAARVGVVAWYCRYIPLSPNSRVVAAT